MLELFDIEIKVVNLSKVNPLPKYAKEGDAGMDLYANISEPITLYIKQKQTIPAGIKVAIPKGYEIQVRPRSGLAHNNSITVLNSPGTIDSGYRNEIGVILINHSERNFIINPGDRIAQIILNKIPNINWKQVEELDDETERGQGGFGSTGTKQKQ
jgi:dUTP pyrophosphatase